MKKLKSYTERRQVLELEKKRISSELEKVKATGHILLTEKVSSPASKAEDEAVDYLELERILLKERKLTDQLSVLEHALVKCENGTYGICDICGKPIDTARLQVRPQSTVCIKCITEQADNAYLRPFFKLGYG